MADGKDVKINVSIEGQSAALAEMKQLKDEVGKLKSQPVERTAEN